MMPMLLPVAALTVILAWWIGTGVIFYLNGLGSSTYRWSMIGATILLVVGFAAMLLLRNETSAAGAFGGFAAGMAVWVWQEVGLLMGCITGPRKRACDSYHSEAMRAWQALQAVLWHELALVASGAVVLFLSSGAANRVGLWTFLVLWTMRSSAKINVFLGVRNLHDDLFPDHLRFLASFMRRRPMNPFLPFSVLLGIVWAWQAFLPALVGAPVFDATCAVLIATLLILGVFEHVAMVLPFPVISLWSWSLGSRLTGAGRPSVGPGIPSTTGGLP